MTVWSGHLMYWQCTNQPVKNMFHDHIPLGDILWSVSNNRVSILNSHAPQRDLTNQWFLHITKKGTVICTSKQESNSRISSKAGSRVDLSIQSFLYCVKISFLTNLDIQTCTTELLSAPSGSEGNCAKLLMLLRHHSVCLTTCNLKSPRLVVLLRNWVLDNNENVARASDNFSEGVFLIYIAWSLTDSWSVHILISPRTKNLLSPPTTQGPNFILANKRVYVGEPKFGGKGVGCCLQESLIRSGDMLVNSAALSKFSSSDRHTGNWHWQSDLGRLIQGAQPTP